MKGLDKSTIESYYAYYQEVKTLQWNFKENEGGPINLVK